MASVSEKTFGQRLQQARNLLALIEGLADYKPSNKDITAASFKTFIDSVDKANGQAASGNAALSEARNIRIEAYHGSGGLVKFSAMVRDFIASLPGGRTSQAFRNVQRECQKMYNYHKPKKEKPGAEPTKNEKKTVSKSEQSFGSIIQCAKHIHEIIKSVQGYAPSNPALTIEGYGQFIANLESLNENASRLLITSNTALDSRGKLYEGADSLKVRMRMIKDYIASSYGKDSKTYKEAVKNKY
jgi:hypothetical protein